MVNIETAVTFITQHGNDIDRARLAYVQHKQAPAPGVVQQFQTSQRADGGWNPFWASDYSSVDATCYQLAQAAQLGLDASTPFVAAALRFLAWRQRGDGSWMETAEVTNPAPPWVKPGNLAATLYLTANAGYWLAGMPELVSSAGAAGAFLARHLDENGRFPSFLHTHWLAAGLWFRLNQPIPANQVLDYLYTQLDKLSAANSAWLLTTMDSNVPHPLCKAAVVKLVGSQQENGRWISDDGPDFDVYTTLEALRAIRQWSDAK